MSSKTLVAYFSATGTTARAARRLAEAVGADKMCIRDSFIANAFDFTSVELSEYLIALCFAVSVIPIVELIKLIQRAVSRGRA